MSDTWRVRAPGKILLCGEYAVLGGAPALCAAVDRYAYADGRNAELRRITAMGEGPLRVNTVDRTVSLDPAPADPARWELVRRVLMEAGGTAAWEMSLDSSEMEQAPLAGGTSAKLGLGSSSAVAVALLAAVDLREHGGAIDDERRLRWFRAAQRAHLAAQGGRGSGVDVAAAAMGGVFVYRRPDADPAHAELRRVAWEKMGLRVVVAFTGKSASTRELVARVEQWQQRDPVASGARMETMAKLATTAAEAATRGDASALLEAVGAYGEQMDALGRDAGCEIVTAELRTLAGVARAHGAVAKPSGAGGGDVGVCFCRDQESEAAVRRALAEAGLSPVDVTLGAPGAGHAHPA